MIVSKEWATIGPLWYMTISTLLKDVMYANYTHQLPEPLHLTIASWPFEAWRLDVVVPLTPKSFTRHIYMLASTDYFSK